MMPESYHVTPLLLTEPPTYLALTFMTEPGFFQDDCLCRTCEPNRA